MRDPQQIRNKIEWYSNVATTCNNNWEEALVAAQNATNSEDRAHHMELAANHQIELGKANMAIVHLKWALAE